MHPPKKSVFQRRPLRRGDFYVKQAGAVPDVREGWRTVGRVFARELVVHQDIGRDVCVAAPMASGQREGGRRKKKMMSGWNELVGK